MSGFTQIDGSLKQISVGSATNIWGVNAAGYIFRYTGNNANPFVVIPGNLIHVSAAADGSVWGVNAGGNVFYYRIDRGGPFIQVGGLSGFRRVSVGSRNDVWGITTTVGAIFRNLVASPIQVPGTLVDVSVGADGTVWGVNGNNELFRFDGAYFDQIGEGGNFMRISVGSVTNIWGVTPHSTIYRGTGNDAEPFAHMPGTLVYVSAAADGTVWGLDAADNIYRYDYT
jgi:virginiamycin B lyase